MKKPLSLVVITRDEEDHIERCIKSVPFASDVVVLDSFSQDKTVERAKALGARVFQEKFLGFGPQKNRAVELANHDWVLCLDADEALSPEAQTAVSDLFASGAPSQDAYQFSRLSYHLGRWIHHGGWFPDWQLRLFNRKKATWDQARIHEKVNVSGEIGRIKEPIQHWVFDNLSDQIQTNNRYSSLGAETLKMKGRHFWVVSLFVKPTSKFLETYIWKRGFLDGLPGFIIAVGAAYSVFLKYAKLWEMENK
jgi:glycosyltransferase involved in cell wall biosynthesis